MPVAANPLTPVDVAPRSVSTSVILSAYFGGKVVQFSWAALLIALGPMWYCLGHESFHPLGTFALLGPTQQVRGHVSELHVLEETDMGDGGVKDAFGVEGSHMIRQTIPRISYSYAGPDGRQYSAVARVGRDDGDFCEEGTPVTVTYAAYNPGASRIEGLRINWASTGSFVMIGFWGFFRGEPLSGLSDRPRPGPRIPRRPAASKRQNRRRATAGHGIPVGAESLQRHRRDARLRG